MGVEEQQARASEAAIQAATYVMVDPIEAAIEAAHDPALGLDRSVCLRDVVEWLRSNSEDALNGQGYIERADEVADEIERTFTASSSSEGAAGFVSEPSTGGE